MLIAFVLWSLSAVPMVRADRIAMSPTSDALPDRLQAIRHRLPDWKRQLDDLKAGGQDVSYPLVTYTVLDHFTAYALEELDTILPGARAASRALRLRRLMPDGIFACRPRERMGNGGV